MLVCTYGAYRFLCLWLTIYEGTSDIRSLLSYAFGCDLAVGGFELLLTYGFEMTAAYGGLIIFVLLVGHTAPHWKRVRAVAKAIAETNP